MLIKFRLAIRVDAGVVCGSCSDDTLIIATHTPAAIQCISWNPHQTNATQTSIQHKLDIFLDQHEQVKSIFYDKMMNISIWITDVGRAYFIQNHRQRRNSKGSTNSDSSGSFIQTPTTPSFSEPIRWSGCCLHGDNFDPIDEATCVAINARFSLIAVGTKSGTIYVYSVHNYTNTPQLSHKMQLPTVLMTKNNGTNQHQKENLGAIQSLAWTLDGYALSAGFSGYGGLAIWSVYGALLCSMDDLEDIIDVDDDSPSLQDLYTQHINNMFWGPEGYQLFILSGNLERNLGRFYSLPIAKSALTSLHHTDNARRCLLQMDDRLLLYNQGGDYQENNTNTIDPDAVNWAHILYPTMYITEHWPIRYASISADGKFIAIAGRRGLAHYNTVSSRWKLFGNQQQENHFIVRGGLVWYKQILIATCENLSNRESKSYEIQLYSRDQNLDQNNILQVEILSSIPLYITMCGSFLLVYTTDNQLSIYVIHYTESNIPSTKIELVRTMSLGSIVSRAARVRGISLFHGDCGELIHSMHDMIQSNILLLVDGKLIILTPKLPSDSDDSDLASQPHENGPTDCDMQYDLHVLMKKVEYYWVGQKSVANLLTSIWGVDGKGIRLFTNVLRGDGYGFHSFYNASRELESEPSTPTTPHSSRNSIIGRPYSLGYRIGIEPSSPHSQSWMEMEGESRWQTSLDQTDINSIYIPLDFYPLAILLSKGVIVGIEQATIYRESLGFLIYKTNTKTHLFLHHVIRYLLQRQLEEDTVVFARAYEKLIYFGHALEILLHTVLEHEAEKSTMDQQDAILPLVIRFLDQFPHALDVIVSCARKTEVALWNHLFTYVGKPEDLFELCLNDGRLRTATSYLIILQTMEPHTTGGKDTIRLLQKAMDVDDYELCKELVRFLSSIDHSGKTLREALVVLQERMVEKTDTNNSIDDTINEIHELNV
ncbi:unnamed protein product [Cunninghamella echinulata]